ncbi:hypothetical protein [Peribacillus frigoritolerans]|uniref:hypothetical protein n=1 Tax=Peribacillus castrilensis TaxID=2897690 RepID=UPI00296F6A1D|nr:hypothetical protein [Peribacillus castrilensis]
MENANQGIKIMLGEAVIQSSFFVFINVKGIQNKEHGDNNKKCNIIEGFFIMDVPIAFLKGLMWGTLFSVPLWLAFSVGLKLS